MPKIKKVSEVAEEIAAETPAVSKVVSNDLSTRAGREAHVARYAKANPVKFAQKKEALEKWVKEVN